MAMPRKQLDVWVGSSGREVRAGGVAFTVVVIKMNEITWDGAWRKKRLRPNL